MSGLDPDHYERRFRLAAGGLPVRRPWVPAERDAIIRAAGGCLGVRDEWVPAIAAQAASVAEAGEVSVHHLPGRWATT